jgi:hypothetical protein
MHYGREEPSGFSGASAHQAVGAFLLLLALFCQIHFP